MHAINTIWHTRIGVDLFAFIKQFVSKPEHGCRCPGHRPTRTKKICKMAT